MRKSLLRLNVGNNLGNKAGVGAAAGSGAGGAFTTAKPSTQGNTSSTPASIYNQQQQQQGASKVSSAAAGNTQGNGNSSPSGVAPQRPPPPPPRPPQEPFATPSSFPAASAAVPFPPRSPNDAKYAASSTTMNAKQAAAQPQMGEKVTATMPPPTQPSPTPSPKPPQAFNATKEAPAAASAAAESTVPSTNASMSSAASLSSIRPPASMAGATASAPQPSSSTANSAQFQSAKSPKEENKESVSQSTVTEGQGLSSTQELKPANAVRAEVFKVTPPQTSGVDAFSTNSPTALNQKASTSSEAGASSSSSSPLEEKVTLRQDSEVSSRVEEQAPAKAEKVEMEATNATTVEVDAEKNEKKTASTETIAAAASSSSPVSAKTETVVPPPNRTPPPPPPPPPLGPHEVMVYKVRRSNTAKKTGNDASTANDNITSYATTVAATTSTRFSPATVMMQVANSAGHQQQQQQQHFSNGNGYGGNNSFRTFAAPVGTHSTLFDAFRASTFFASANDTAGASSSSSPSATSAASRHLLMPAVGCCAFTRLGLKQYCPTCLFAQTGQDAAPDAHLLDFAMALRLLSAMGANISTTSSSSLLDNFYIFSACDRPALHCGGQSFFSLDRAESMVGCGKLLAGMAPAQSLGGVGGVDVFLRSMPSTAVGGRASFAGQHQQPQGQSGFYNHFQQQQQGMNPFGAAANINNGGSNTSPSGMEGDQQADATAQQQQHKLTAEEFAALVTEISGPTDLVACVSLAPHLAKEIIVKYLDCLRKKTKATTASLSSPQDAAAASGDSDNARHLLYAQITVYTILLQLSSSTLLMNGSPAGNGAPPSSLLSAMRLQGPDMLNCLLRTVATFPTLEVLREKIRNPSSSASSADASSSGVISEMSAQDIRLLDVADGLHASVAQNLLKLLHSVSPDDQLKLFCEHKLNGEKAIAAGPEHDLWRSVVYYLHRKRRHEVMKLVSQRSLTYVTEVIVPLLLNVPAKEKGSAKKSDSSSADDADAPTSVGLYARMIPSSEVNAVITDIADGLLERVDAIDRAVAMSGQLSEEDIFVLVRCGTALGILCGVDDHTLSLGPAAKGGRQARGGVLSEETDAGSYDAVINLEAQKSFIERCKDINIAVPKSFYDFAQMCEKIVQLAFETPSIMMRFVLKHFNIYYAKAWAYMENYLKEQAAAKEEQRRSHPEAQNLPYRGADSGRANRRKADASPTDTFTKVDTGVVSDPMADGNAVSHHHSPSSFVAAKPKPSTPNPSAAAFPAECKVSKYAALGVDLWWAKERPLPVLVAEPAPAILTDAVSASADEPTGVATATTADSPLPPPAKYYQPLRLIESPLPRKVLSEYAETLEEIADHTRDNCEVFTAAAPSFKHIIRSISVESSHEEIRQTALLFAMMGATDHLKALIHKELNQNVMMPSASIAILHDLVRRCPPNTESYQILMSALTDLLVPPSASRSRWDDYVVMRQLVRSEYKKGRLGEGAHRALLRWTSTNATKSIFFSLVSVRMILLGLLFAGYYSGNSLEGGLVRKRLKKKFKQEFAESVEREREFLEQQRKLNPTGHPLDLSTSALSASSTNPLPLAPGETVFATPEAAKKLLAFGANAIEACGMPRDATLKTIESLTSSSSLRGLLSHCPFKTRVSMPMYSSSPNDVLRDLAMSFRESLPSFWLTIFFLYPIYSPAVQRYLVRNVCDGGETVVVLKLATGSSALDGDAVTVIRKHCGPKCCLLFVGEREVFAEVAGASTANDAGCRLVSVGSTNTLRARCVFDAPPNASSVVAPKIASAVAELVARKRTNATPATDVPAVVTPPKKNKTPAAVPASAAAAASIPPTTAVEKQQTPQLPVSESRPIPFASSGSAANVGTTASPTSNAPHSRGTGSSTAGLPIIPSFFGIPLFRPEIGLRKRRQQEGAASDDASFLRRVHRFFIPIYVDVAAPITLPDTATIVRGACRVTKAFDDHCSTSDATAAAEDGSVNDEEGTRHPKHFFGNLLPITPCVKAYGGQLAAFMSDAQLLGRNARRVQHVITVSTDPQSYKDLLASSKSKLADLQAFLLRDSSDDAQGGESGEEEEA